MDSVLFDTMNTSKIAMDGFGEEWVKAPSWDTIEEITSKYEEFVRCS